MNVLFSGKAQEEWQLWKSVSGGFWLFKVKSFAFSDLVSIRLKSVKNIEKITKSMKMVSAAKFQLSERELKPARTYGIGAQGTYLHVQLVYHFTVLCCV